MEKKFYYTEDMFKNFLEENNITYKKNKNGMPNMKYKLIRELKEEHMKMKHIEFLKSINSSYKKKETFMMSENTSKIFNCGICYEEKNKDIDGFAHLKCGHDLCIECYSLHIRENNNCPFCRDEICQKPKKIIRLPREMYHSIIQNTLNQTFEERDGLTFVEYIGKILSPISENSDIAAIVMNDIKMKILTEIREVLKDVIHDTERYYMSFA